MAKTGGSGRGRAGRGRVGARRPELAREVAGIRGFPVGGPDPPGSGDSASRLPRPARPRGSPFKEGSRPGTAQSAQSRDLPSQPPSQPPAPPPPAGAPPSPPPPSPELREARRRPPPPAPLQAAAGALPLSLFSSLSSVRNMAHHEHEEQEVEQAIDPGWAHVRNEIIAYLKGKKAEKILTTQQQQELQDELSGRQIRRDYDLPIPVDDDDDDDDDPDPEFTAAARASRRSYAEEDERRRGLGTSGYFFNPKIQYKDDVHNDGEVMRGTMNVITRIARSMNERLDAVAEVLEPQEVMGLGVLCQDMKIIHNHPNNNKEAKGKHNSSTGDMKANKGKQGMIGDTGLHIHPFLVPQNCHIQTSALVVGLVIWAIFKLLDMVVSSLRDTQEKVQVNKQQHREASKEDSKILQILCLALDIHSMEDMSMCHLFNLMRVGQTPLESAGSTDPTRPESGSAGWEGLQPLGFWAHKPPTGGVLQLGGGAAEHSLGVSNARTPPWGGVYAQRTPAGETVRLIEELMAESPGIASPPLTAVAAGAGTASPSAAVTSSLLGASESLPGGSADALAGECPRLLEALSLEATTEEAREMACPKEGSRSAPTPSGAQGSWPSCRTFMALVSPSALL
ncbi:hypothetical protein Taro_048543 [Colocasia esculenta]|uniref:Uncharacterized protein n=1 Tax=Colocasia esculenta TaxID=4460 RepID=A0A843X8F6_COLES|nr:hypothetical protein [Colocasia esculenta]